MKAYMMLILTLFSFSAGHYYQSDDYECKDNQLRMKYEENWYDISLFNVELKEESDICSYIQGDVAFEFEESIALNQKEAYVFVDGKLLQKQLVEDEIATIKLNSPAYKYDMNDKKIAVIAEVDEVEEIEKNLYSRKVAYLLLGIWGCICLMLIHHKLRYQKDINT